MNVRAVLLVAILIAPPIAIAGELPVERLQAMVEAAGGDAPGIVVRVETGDGKIWTGAAGVSAIVNGSALTPDTAFRIYSISKMATAATVLTLVDEGRLDLDDRIGTLLDASLIAGIPQAETVTIRQLMTHTSGIRDYFGDPRFIDLIRADFSRRWTPAELIAIAADGAPPAPPGTTEAHYSNTNYVLLGLIIEAVTGMPLAEAVRTRIFDPLGMSATYSGDEPARPELVHGYIPVDNGELLDVSAVDLSVAWAAGGLVSSAADLVRLVRGLFEGDLLSPSSRELMTSDFRPLADRPVDYGYGTFLFRPLDPSPIGHSGEGPGFGALAAWWPGSGVVVVVLTNIQGEVHFDLLLQIAAALQL